MKRAALSLALTAMVAVSAALAHAQGDAEAGKAKSAVCAGCHGADGISPMPIAPNLAGQKEAYFIKTMKDYRDGKRQDAMMGPAAQGLSDADFANLAAYYAAMK
jgi:cytochrome c553